MTMSRPAAPRRSIIRFASERVAPSFALNPLLGGGVTRFIPGLQTRATLAEARSVAVEELERAIEANATVAFGLP